MNSTKHVVTYDNGVKIKENGVYVPYAELERQKRVISNTLESILHGYPTMLEMVLRGKF